MGVDAGNGGSVYVGAGAGVGGIGVFVGAGGGFCVGVGGCTPGA